MTVPNVLSFGRVVASPVVGALVVHGRYSAALGLFAAVSVTDLLDGWIARRWHQQTVLGTVLDPFADKLLMTISTAALGYTGARRAATRVRARAHARALTRWLALARTRDATGLLPLPLAALIFARDAALLGSGFVLRYMSLAPPRTLRRYFDFQLPTAEVRPSTVSKVNTVLQVVLLTASLAAPVYGFVGHPALPLLWWTVAGTCRTGRP